MKTKHTPGPWALSGIRIYAHPPGSDFEEPFGIAEVRKTVYLPHGSPKIKEYQWNAHLIAAAPEMLEALETAKKYVLGDIGPGREDEVLEYFDAVIAKARGES